MNGIHQHCVPFPCCRKPDCPKNYIKHTTNTATNVEEAQIHLQHHKNSSKQGAVEYEVAPCMVKVWAVLEAAAAFLGPQARGFFFSVLKYERETTDLYKDNYMSVVISKQLSKCGLSVGAKKDRREYHPYGQAAVPAGA